MGEHVYFVLLRADFIRFLPPHINTHTHTHSPIVASLSINFPVSKELQLFAQPHHIPSTIDHSLEFVAIISQIDSSNFPLVAICPFNKSIDSCVRCSSEISIASYFFPSDVLGIFNEIEPKESAGVLF